MVHRKYAMTEQLYKIIRIYREIRTPSEVKQYGLTLKEAMKHCNDPSTSTETWFDGFDKMTNVEMIRYKAKRIGA